MLERGTHCLKKGFLVTANRGRVMGKNFKTALLALALMGFSIAALPQIAYAGMGSGGCSVGHSHGCTGYGGMLNHPEFNDHCDHSEGDTNGTYPGAENCCGDPGWVATHPPAPTPANSENNAKVGAKPVSTKPRSLNVSTD